MAKLFYQGHASFRITTNAGKEIFIDPFAGAGYKTPADLVLITHEHYDHNDVKLITFKPGGYIIRAKDALTDGEYHTFESQGAFIRAVPAYNSHHNRTECVGYVIEVDGLKIYHAGDTDLIPEMKELTDLNIDYALLPIDGTYTMTPEDATKAAILINPKHMIPMHMRPGMLWDYHQAMKVTAPMAMLMKPNDWIDL